MRARAADAGAETRAPRRSLRAARAAWLGFAALFACAARLGLGCGGEAAGTSPAASASAHAPIEPGLRVVLHPVPRGRSGLEVRIELDGPAAARVGALGLEPHFADLSGPALIEALTLVDAAGALAAREDRAHGRFLLARPVVGERLTVRYFARADPASVLGLHVDPAGVWAVGHGFLLLPELEDALDVRMRFELDAFGGGDGAGAPGIEAASSFGVGNEVLVHASARELAHAVYVVGPLAVEEGGYGERVVVVAQRDFPMREALSASAELGRTVRRAFGMKETRPVTLLVIASPGMGEGHEGVWLERSFALWLEMGRGFDPRVRILMAHEWSHAFFGSVMRVVAPEAGSDAPVSAAWFSEGFAIDFARELALRAALIAPRDYVADLNRSLEAVERAAGLGAGPGQPGDANHRGALYAARLAALLGRDRTTLEAFLLDLAATEGSPALTLPWSSTPRRDVSSERFAARIALSFGREESERFAHSLEPNAPAVELPADAFGPCIRRVRGNAALFELGFDAGGLAAGVVRALVAGSAAARAGLREGDRVIEAHGVEGDNPDRDVVLVVSSGEVHRTVRYKPRTAAPRVRYELAAVPSCLGQAAP